ncbi:peptidoglycan DD-metalloendopeptidase family protein [Thiomicrorhabdus sp. ZW0627]|uniref:M23 family metallopeptidase n=1 Tax=Thiomicrorhabdus sp. ZW0627 TaxID=3039774 RepID=UPI00243634ED|nr:M23 family metallopeptidase [Thiomicrorhabdus sp. ZW0627]MDG6774601.1 peptidoglycan DD-metalloendopeptidase family protein [Thiomicrorhabdus sp. ZW0627]
MSESLPIVFGVYPLLLSGLALIWLLRLQHRSWPNWAAWVLACGSIVAFAFVTGPWAYTSYYLRYVFLGLFALTVVFSYFRMKRSSPYSRTRDDRISVASVLIVLLFTVLNSLAITSYYPSGKTLDVTFPLKSGTYYVLQGGDSIVTNPFHALAHTEQAIDIVKLNSLGNQADDLAPRVLSAYQIFGEKLYSPCQGTILEVRDNLPDNPPGNPDTEHPEGNYIVLQCLMGDILMAHLRRDSIKVVPGSIVTMGQPLAEIGNSGNTLEPHLHIEATKDGKPIWLSFDGRSLSINSLITRK